LERAITFIAEGVLEGEQENLSTTDGNVEIHGISHSALLLHNHESRPHHVIYHMTLSVIFDDAIHITKALLITDKSIIRYWLAY